jgi:serine/threonine-protein kinase HipA
MTSKYQEPQEVYVWFFPNKEATPVVMGRISRHGTQYVFNYGRTWLANNKAIPLYLPELSLKSGIISPLPALNMAGCLRDGLPDSWGRRIIIHRLTGLKHRQSTDIEFDELTYMLHSGSDRIGAIDFQESATSYVPRQEKNASLEELYEATERITMGNDLSPELARALFHGSSIGGARPKALINDNARKMIAKFSIDTDSYNVVKAEFIAMMLAKKVGLDVASVELTQASGKDILLIERFDRIPIDVNKWGRRAMVSALTLFGLDEMHARYAHYGELADIIRIRFVEPRKTLRELFGRMVFNILVGNTDDHARNHAAFWDGQYLSLTPAYDICPQHRTGREATQAMLIHETDRRSTMATCLASALQFQLSALEAQEIIDHQVDCITQSWSEVCEQARLSRAERTFLWKRQFLNDYAFD